MPFEAAPFGVTGLETAFSALYTHLVEPGLLKLETLLERMSAGPARAYGLDAPRIAVGAPANLVLLDLKASRRVSESDFRSRSANSWLLGQTVKGQVRLTIAAGRVAFEGDRRGSDTSGRSPPRPIAPKSRPRSAKRLESSSRSCSALTGRRLPARRE